MPDSGYELLEGAAHRHGELIHAHPHSGSHSHERDEEAGAAEQELRHHRHHQNGHSHSHGLVDESIKRSRRGLRAVGLSLAVLGTTAAAQLAIFVATGSIALLADLIHNFGDAATAIPLGIAFLMRSERAATITRIKPFSPSVGTAKRFGQRSCLAAQTR